MTVRREDTGIHFEYEKMDTRMVPGTDDGGDKYGLTRVYLVTEQGCRIELTRYLNVAEVAIEPDRDTGITEVSMKVLIPIHKLTQELLK